jgi:hypothetical protein
LRHLDVDAGQHCASSVLHGALDLAHGLSQRDAARSEQAQHDMPNEPFDPQGTLLNRIV